MSGSEHPVLTVQGLGIFSSVGNRSRPLLEDWSVSLERGGAVGLVGESGGGKSLACLALVGLLPTGTQMSAHSSILFNGEQLVGATPERWRAMRGRGIGYLFQDAQAGLNPIRSVDAHFVHTQRTRMGLDRSAARVRALELLEEVELTDPERVLRALPGELSGGMAQRVMIALALSLDPLLLVADEPTSALDGPVRVQVLDLLNRLRSVRNMGLLLVSHDVGVIARTCDRTAVQYGGRIIESGLTTDLLDQPRHPYTQALLDAQPSLMGGELPRPIPGSVQELGSGEEGCAFGSRCSYRKEKCSQVPPLVTDEGRAVACWLASTAETHV